MAIALGILHTVPPARAAITTTGDVSPAPPVGGGAVVGPFRVGSSALGTMNISGGTALTSSGAATVGDAEGGIGIVTMSGSGSDWTLTTAGGDLTVGSNGTGSITISNLANLTVNDDSFLAAQIDSLAEVSISGLGTVWNNGDDMNIGQRGRAIFDIFDGARLLSDANILGDEATGDGWVIVSDQLSLWRADSTMTVADAGHALLQVLDGGRVENTSATVGNFAGSTGTVEVAGLGSLWQSTTSVTIGESGHGTLLITDGGRVTTGGGLNLTTIGSATTGTGFVEVRGLDSLWSVGGELRVGDSGAGTLRVLDGGRVTSGIGKLGDTATARAEALVDGVGSWWAVTGELTISDPGEAHLTISNGGVVSSTSLTRIVALGRLTLDGGRLEIGSASGLLNTGVVEGDGTIEGVVANNAGGQLRVDSGDALVLRNTLTNAGLVDVQSGELEVFGATANNAGIDARDGAVLRFRSTLDNNNNAQLAITSGIVDMFGNVDNNAGGEIVVGADAKAIFHDVVTNSGDLIMMPGSDVLMLENLGFGAGSSLNVLIDASDLPNDNGNPNDGFGQLQVAGTATLAGTLDVNLSTGYSPMLGDEFEILIADGGRSGMFASESLPALGGGLGWDVLYNPNSVVLAVVAGAAVPGDYNRDGTVSAADYAVWRDTRGSTTNLVADGSGNNVIDTADYNFWRARFGNTAGGAANADWAQNSVAEPAAGVLGMVACAAVIIGSRRLRRRAQRLAMMKQREVSTEFLSIACLPLVLLVPCHVTWAVNNAYVGPNLGNWNIDANWMNGAEQFVPDQFFNEAALINNFNTVVLNAAAMNSNSNGDVGGIKIGISGVDPSGDAETGGLRIESGGVLRSVVTPSGTETGSIAVGAGVGHGSLTIVGSGMLSGTSLSLAGDNASSISLSDTASLSVSGAADLERVTTIAGPGVNFKASGDLTLGPVSTLIADIRDVSQHSPLKTDGAASINGTFKPMFTGVTPMLGKKWTIVDAATAINGTFATFDVSLAPSLPSGLSYQIIQATAGTRTLLQLSIAETSLLGDYNQNGTVSAADYTVWRDTLGSTANLAANGNGNSAIDAGDYGVWKQNFGNTAGSGSHSAVEGSAVVPEPGTAVLVAISLLAAVGSASKRWRCVSCAELTLVGCRNSA